MLRNQFVLNEAKYSTCGCPVNCCRCNAPTTNANGRDDFLPIPKLDFNKPGDERRELTANTNAREQEDVLPLPKMDWSPR